MYSEERIVCPVCGREAIYREKRTYTKLGLVEIRSIICNFCGYRHIDEILVQPREYGPEEIIIDISGEADLRRYIFKSRYATIEFPDLGIEIIPGPDARDEIYPIEGLLEKYIERIDASCQDSEDPVQCRVVVERLRRVLNGDEKIRIVIRDPSRFSRELVEYMKEVK